MNPIPPHFKLHTHPVADPKAVVSVGNARFTLLTSRLVRMEYNPEARFEDRPSQVFWHRLQPVPLFESRLTGDQFEIITPHLHLQYRSGNPFRRDTLSIKILERGLTWYYGDLETGNLGGTARTLDNTSGIIPLESGLISRSGWKLVDDLKSLVFNPQGWLVPRQASPETQDLYFFGYGHDYQDCLSGFYKVSEAVPMLPRWALGNWWSRYWAYSQQELSQLMLDFKDQQIPLAVCIIDMDWHLTQTGNLCSGWTGYTWNKELFPDPPGFLDSLSQLGLKKSLNLHPAEGIHPHEESYPQMAVAMGIDPASEKPVEFNPEDPRFVQAYFDILHHPMEEQGIDFWWIDWQQGNPVRLPGLNLLWWINHIHFQDHARQVDRRPMIFSRWGGLGNHRYPIGFSGDTFITWDSLAFQPHFTASAANVGYGWWSHDIGGHMGGVEDPELYTRWVQYGVFSPILRLHSTNNPFHERRPWGYDAETLRITRQALQLRHALIPYLYSLGWQYHRKGIAPIRPMYYLYPKMEQAYSCPNQYTFGSELIAAPFITPRDPDTRLSRQVVWLPPGEWFGFHDGQHWAGDSWQALYGALDEIPVFARAGAIIPLAEMPAWGGIENPGLLNIHIFPGASNRFELYEDDGESSTYLNGEYAITVLSQEWSETKQVFQIHPVEGAVQLVPARREYRLVFHAILSPDQIQVARNNVEQPVESDYDANLHQLTLSGISLAPADTLVVTLDGAQIARRSQNEICSAKYHSLLSAFRLASYAKQALAANATEIISNPSRLAAYLTSLSRSQMRALLETITGAGMEHLTNVREKRIILWNNAQDPIAQYRQSVQQYHIYDPHERFQVEQGTIPSFKLFRPARDFQMGITQLDILYGNLLTLSSSHSSEE
jgi:alpha-glucosidase (family GH31 glycosyl hydrolase)